MTSSLLAAPESKWKFIRCPHLCVSAKLNMSQPLSGQRETSDRMWRNKIKECFENRPLQPSWSNPGRHTRLWPGVCTAAAGEVDGACPCPVHQSSVLPHRSVRNKSQWRKFFNTDSRTDRQGCYVKTRYTQSLLTATCKGEPLPGPQRSSHLCPPVFGSARLEDLLSSVRRPNPPTPPPQLLPVHPNTLEKP